MTLFFSTFEPGRFRNTYPPIDRQYFPYQYAGRTYYRTNEDVWLCLLVYIFLPSFVVYAYFVDYLRS